VDAVAKSFDLDTDQPVVDAVEKVAEERMVPMAAVALAWVLSKPVVTAPIVGATKPHHLADAVAALDITLAEEEIRRLEEPYTPQAPYWW
jgi:1-deoxyxylulose-5-phosphate synthase